MFLDFNQRVTVLCSEDIVMVAVGRLSKYCMFFLVDIGLLVDDQSIID